MLPTHAFCVLTEIVPVGAGLTVTLIVLVAVHPAELVTVTVYVPPKFVEVTFLIGFCFVEV